MKENIYICLSNSVYINKKYDELFKRGGNIAITENVNIKDNCALIKNDTIVNLNNKTITSGIFTESNGIISEGNSDSFVFYVNNGAKLEIGGNGEVKSQPAKYSMAVWAKDGTVIINGGKFYNAGEGSDLIYASGSGKIYIHNGEFFACKKQEGVSGTANVYSTLNIKDKDRDTAEIIVYGGKFYNFNPINNYSEGPNTSFVANGYTVYANGVENLEPYDESLGTIIYEVVKK